MKGLDCGHFFCQAFASALFPALMPGVQVVMKVRMSRPDTTRTHRLCIQLLSFQVPRRSLTLGKSVQGAPGEKGGRSIYNRNGLL